MTKKKTENTKTENTKTENVKVENVNIDYDSETGEIDHNPISFVQNPVDFFKGLEMQTTYSLTLPGQGIRGIYRGKGEPVPMTEDGEITHEVNTHKIQLNNGLIIRLLGSAILDRHLENVKSGTTVAILRGPTVARGKKQLTMYQVAAG